MNGVKIIVLLIVTSSISFSKAQPTFDWNELELSTDSLLKQNGSIGASVIVVNQDSVLFHKGFGHTILEKKEPITDSTLFVLGSITKTFTAIGVLKLVEEGKITLHDEVKLLAAELPIFNKWEDKFPLRVYHLLEHTSGFDELHLKDRSIPVVDDEFPLIEGIKIVKSSLKVRWKPGKAFAYSNVGYLIAGYLIEKISGKKYNDYMVQEVLKPLKMDNSSLRLSEINQELLAKSYSSHNQKLPFKHIFTRPTGSLISSSKDMAFFLMMLLNKGGSILNVHRFNELETHHSIEVFDKTENGYRLGIYPRFRKGRVWLGHGGSINKYNSEFEYCHELGLGVFIVSNGPNATKTVDGILNAFHNLIPNLREDTNILEQPSTILEVNELEGYYVLTSPRNQLHYPFTELFTEGLFVYSENGNVMVSNLSGWQSRIIPTGKNMFSPSGANNEYQYVIDDSTGILYTALGSSYKKIPFLLIALLGFSLIISFITMCLSQISLLIRLINSLIKRKLKLSPQLILEVGSSVFLASCVLYLLLGVLKDIHKPQFLTVVIMLCTILFPLFTVLGVVQTFRLEFQHIRAKIWTISLATSMTVWSCYLIYWGFFGFTIWTY